jgi:PPK2 family polyphosphate:nucleotide phosphotransferase
VPPAKKNNEVKLDRIGGRFLVPAGKKVSLTRDFKTSISLAGFTKQDLSDKLTEGVQLLAAEQDKLYAQNQYALLVILQAMDAAGKDSTIKHVMSGVNPQGCQVYSFKAPSTEELDHDYLWRCARLLPERGNIGIFNRSYYEEVLVTRVHPQILNKQQLPAALIDKKIWQRRFEEMNNFEKYLVNNGIIVLKFFLHVSKEEQRKRFLARIDRKDKNWKFSADDARDRKLWDDYADAYEDCLGQTSTKSAPWHVIPADDKPFTRLAVANIMYETLKGLKLQYPRIDKEQRQELLNAKEFLSLE